MNYHTLRDAARKESIETSLTGDRVTEGRDHVVGRGHVVGSDGVCITIVDLMITMLDGCCTTRETSDVSVDGWHVHVVSVGDLDPFKRVEGVVHVIYHVGVNVGGDRTKHVSNWCNGLRRHDGIDLGVYDRSVGIAIQEQWLDSVDGAIVHGRRCTNLGEHVELKGTSVESGTSIADDLVNLLSGWKVDECVDTSEEVVVIAFGIDGQGVKEWVDCIKGNDADLIFVDDWQGVKKWVNEILMRVESVHEFREGINDITDGVTDSSDALLLRINTGRGDRDRTDARDNGSILSSSSWLISRGRSISRSWLINGVWWRGRPGLLASFLFTLRKISYILIVDMRMTAPALEQIAKRRRGVVDVDLWEVEDREGRRRRGLIFRAEVLFCRARERFTSSRGCLVTLVKYQKLYVSLTGFTRTLLFIDSFHFVGRVE